MNSKKYLFQERHAKFVRAMVLQFFYFSQIVDRDTCIGDCFEIFNKKKYEKQEMQKSKIQLWKNRNFVLKT